MVPESMGGRRHRIAAALAGAVLALPAAAWGQSAGDDQYEDPFAPQPGQGQTNEGSAGVDQGEPAPVPSEPTPVPETTASQAPAPTPAATTAVAAQEQLPRTGADAGPIALAGTLLLASGVALRVRLSAPGRRRP